jgi:hypothetical protein
LREGLECSLQADAYLALSAVPTALTVCPVLVLIATAEPRGAYHLTPLRTAFARSHASFTHLMPYPEPVQGEAVIPVSSDVSTIESCDRVVITGGVFSAWTELVARRAVALGKPVLFSELSYVSASEPVCPGVGIAHTTALSPDGASSLRRYLNVENVEITGTPALDGLPAWRPVPRRALLLSTSDMHRRDPSHTLVAIATALRDAGWQVRLRPHPREDIEPWAGFDIVVGETQAESASSAQVVIGYPGSAHVLAAAVGAPVISLAPTEEFQRVFTPLQRAALSAHTVGVYDTLAQVADAMPADPEAVASVVGPIGGAADRIVAAWTGPLR